MRAPNSMFGIISIRDKIFYDRFSARDYKGDREAIPHIHPIPWVIRLELFLTPQISKGI